MSRPRTRLIAPLTINHPDPNVRLAYHQCVVAIDAANENRLDDMATAIRLANTYEARMPDQVRFPELQEFMKKSVA